MFVIKQINCKNTCYISLAIEIVLQIKKSEDEQLCKAVNNKYISYNIDSLDDLKKLALNQHCLTQQ